jgi:membrane fusion protein (multidrug efflux system)
MTAPGPVPRAPRRARLLFVSATLLLLAGTFALCVFSPEPERVAAAGAEATAVPVPALTVAAQPLERSSRFSGVVEPKRRVELLSESSGRVLRCGAEELETVEADQVLVEVDPLLAEVAVERAAAALARAESQLALARDERRRWETLATSDVASVSRRDQAVSNERVATANQREARANLAQARDELAKKTIRAPFRGVLQAFPVEVGETLRPGDRVAELLDIESARIVLGVSDREVVGMRAGSPVAVELEAWPGERFPGTVARVASAADVASLKFPVEIELPNPERRILPGMVARVTLALADERPLRVVPREAVVESFGVRFVYVLAEEEEGDWVARRRPVELRELAFRPELFELVDGVADGERVAAGGTRELRDGVRVRITRHEAAAPQTEEEAGS